MSSAVISSSASESHFLDKVILDNEVADLLGLPVDTTRAEITKSFMKYCQTNGLLGADGETIHLNVELVKVFNLDPRESMNILNLHTFLRCHYKKPDSQPCGFLDKVRLTDKLAVFLGLPSGTTLTRLEITKSFLTYCIKNGLKDGLNDGTRINPDAALTELFNLQPGDFVSILNLQRYINSLYME